MLDLILFIDADACPVKAECYRVAERHRAQVFVVANSFISVPREPWIQRIVVSHGPDVADDWIAERASASSVTVTTDVPLASRCIKAGGLVVTPTGKLHTDSTIGDALATRNLMDSLRSAGTITSGPKPFAPRDRSAFLSALDLAMTRLRRAR